MWWNRVVSSRLVGGASPRLERGFSSVVYEKPLFDKILIANRGEIACRVIRTARRMGIKTVSVYSDADEFAKHVRLADEAIRVGPAPSSESYLNVDAIMEAVRSSGAQAVHPGYGFLSENNAFAKRLEQEGVVFIGPPSSAIIAMGDKIESKRLASNAGVHTIPGYDGEVDTADHAVEISRQIGYPVMIKASAGGGGKGMRIAWNDREAIEGFRLSKQEAKKSFGDDRMLIEKFVNQPRHIEIQVICDGHGNYCYLPERECSIQRRNQKVIEEAPSCALDPETRRAMGEQAVQLARAVDYRSAGTVEMLVDADKNFYFLEMNTRLQVEHPITEYITGVDLVEEMIRVAAGLPLTFRQEDVKIKGWALESRVYAEDPTRNFLPSIGTLKTYVEPGLGDPDVRVDSGVLQGSEISMFYDPMICKLVTYGATRDAAVDKMRYALDTYVIQGLDHNIPFLRLVLENERFLKGHLTTKFIDEEFPGGFHGFKLSPEQRRALFASAGVASYIRRLSLFSESALSFVQPPLVQSFAVSIEHDVDEIEATRVDVSFIDELQFAVNVGGIDMSVETSWDVGNPVFEASINGDPYVLQIQNKPQNMSIQLLGTRFPMIVDSLAENDLRKYLPEKKRIDTSKTLLSPMPGSIVSVAVKAGEQVVVGEELCVVEAMKMQNVLRSEVDGVIKSVHVNAGDNVAVDEVLIEFV